jgi:hypothetical protein
MLPYQQQTKQTSIWETSAFRQVTYNVAEDYLNISQFLQVNAGVVL